MWEKINKSYQHVLISINMKLVARL